MSKEYPIQNVAEQIIKGEIPSNEQLDSALEKAEEALEQSTKEAHLNVHGQVLANDAMKILESTKKIIDEKNLGDHLHKLAELGTSVGEKVGETAQNLSSAQGTISKAVDTLAMKGDLRDIMNDIRKLVYYSLHSSEFRSILVDAIELLQYSLNLTKDKMMEASEKLKQTISEKVPEQPVSQVSSQIYPTWYVSSTAVQPLPMQTETEATKTSQTELSDIYEQKLLQFRKKFDSLADKVSKKREYREIYDKWTSITDKLGAQLKKLGYTSGKVVTEIEGKMEELSEDKELKKTWNELKDLVEGFSGRGSVDKLMNQISGLLEEFNNNPNVSAFLHSLKLYLNKIIEDPNLRLGQVTVTQEFRDLVDKLYASLDAESIRNRLNELVSSSQAMLQSIKTDVASTELMSSLAQFGKDFALDINNKPSPSLIQDSLVQLKNLLVPLIRQQIIALKVPKISKSNETYDFSIESLSIHMEDIIPSQIRITTKNFMGLDVQRLQMTATRGLIVLKIKDLKAKFTDLHFSYDRKVLPRISDSGVADVDMTRGRGMFAKIVWKITESKEGLVALHLDTVTCKIDNLSIRVKKSNHHVLENLAITLFGGWVKNAVAESVVNSIVETLLPLEESINGIFKEISFKHFVENANAKLQDVYEKGTEAQPIKAVKAAAKATLEGAKQAAQTITETVTSVPEKVEKITEKVMEATAPTDASKAEEILPSGIQIPISIENRLEVQYPESISSGSMTWYRSEEVLNPGKKIATQTDEILHKSFGGGVMVVGETQENYESSESYEESEPIGKEAQGGFTTEKKESEIISEILEPAERLSRLETHVPAPKESPPLPLKNPPLSDEKAFDTTTQVGFSHDESNLPYFINPDDVLTLPKTEERTMETNPEEKHAK